MRLYRTLLAQGTCSHYIWRMSMQQRKAPVMILSHRLQSGHAIQD